MACKAPVHRSEHFYREGVKDGGRFRYLYAQREESWAGPWRLDNIPACFSPFFSSLKWIDSPVTLDIGVGPGGKGGGFFFLHRVRGFI